MSNPNVGNVYQQVINDVINSSRVDFEEGGVDESVLEELARGWQKRLSSLGVAQFPWDPKQEPTPAPVMSNPPPIASNYHMDTPPQPQPTFSVPPMPPMQQPMGDNANGPRIKAEPGVENGISLPSYNGGSAMTAQQRATQHLQAQYGSRAAASISAIQSNLPQQGHQQNMQQQPQQRPSGQPAPQRPQLTQGQYQQVMRDEAARRQSQLQNIGNAQSDGAGDIETESVGVMKRFNDQGQEVEMGRIEIDHMIKRKIEAMGRSMEGGGLMLPLKERAPTPRSKKRKVAVPGTASMNVNLKPTSAIPPSAPPQLDGVNDDDDEDSKDDVLKEEDDEDAINSDLDDPDDGLGDDTDDEGELGHIMLCMYDKVQRVKNKWKCVMKDGVLTVNGKEYVFHKASGEYEW